MKISALLMLRAWLIFTLPTYCFGASVYLIQPSHLSNNLIVHVNRTGTHAATRLTLHGISWGVSNQVQNVVCDGHSAQEKKLGEWLIPGNCHHLQWEISLKTQDTLASAQQSIKAQHFILLSEASSLPRLNDATAPEVLKITIPDVQT